MLHSTSFDETEVNYEDNSYSNLGQRIPVKDENNHVRMKAGFLGLGMLTPWCIIIGAPDYWIDCVGTDKIGADMSFYFMIFNFLSLGLCLYMASSNEYWNKNPGKIIAAAYFVFLLPLMFVSAAKKPGYGSLLLISCCFGIGQGISQTEVFRFIAILPKRYTGDCVSGQAVAGLLFSTLRLLTKSSGSNDESGAGIVIYFFCGLLVVFASLIISYYLPQDDFVRYYHNNNGNTTTINDDDLNSNQKVISLSTIDGNGSNNNSQKMKTSKSQGGSSYESLYEDQEQALNDLNENSSSNISSRSSPLSPIHNDKSKITYESLKSVGLEIKDIGILVFLIFCCSLMFFPALTTHMHSKNGAGSWFPVLNGLIFNIFDLIGRLSAQKYLIQKEFWNLAVVGRFVFFLLFFPLAFYYFPDILVYMLVLLLAISNGTYILTIIYLFHILHFIISICNKSYF